MDDTLALLITFCPFLFLFCTIPILGLLGMFVILQIGRQQTNDLQQAWVAFGQANELVFDKGSFFVFPKLTGQYRGRPVMLTLFRIPRRRISIRYTLATTPIRVQPDVQLEVLDKTQTGYLIRIAIDQTLPIGDARFAERFEVTSNSMQFAQRLLSPALQTALLDSRISNLIVERGELKLRYRDFQTQPEVLRAMLELLSRAAEMAE